MKDFDQMTREEQVAAIEDALDRLLTAAIEADASRPTLPIRIYSVADLVADRSRAYGKAEQLAHNPIGAAARLGVRALGEYLDELGGHDLMGDVCQRVADRHPHQWQKRTDIMDKRWDGIGSWYA